MSPKNLGPLLKRSTFTRGMSAAAIVAAALSVSAMTTATPASAAIGPDENVAILPTDDQKVNAAHNGSDKPVRPADSKNGFSLVETWRLTEAEPGSYFLMNQYFGEGTVYLKGGGSVGSAATASSFNINERNAYRWKIVGDRFSAELVNVKSGLRLTYHKAGTGFDTTRFTMDTQFKAGQKFNLKHLSFP
ncbi:hypothetical protein G5C60_27115 [Streptomyces sp. HC44]|uniref:Ricin B lectin domain-containing protein n=1 Tax=Streptomyces scabichelini TaxID=2711217 RepID=A0A6G4VBJ1_9ACTN|nr:hypothetical protein [Streptomyces scabichelini]NGO11173.1 hypothetical protein [Streptomyces scabichelini]